MKKILFISSNFPWPPTDGERVRTFHLIRELASSCNVTVAHPGPALLPASLLQALPGTIEWIPYQKRKSNMFVKIAAIFSLTPVFYKLANSAGLSKWMRGLPKDCFDVIHLDGLPAFNYYRLANAITKNVVVDLRDSWSLLYQRLYETGGQTWMQFAKTKLVNRIEKRIARSCRKLILISDVDARQIESRYPSSSRDIRIIPNGVSEEFFHVPIKNFPGVNPVVAFTGAMDYSPNEQAAFFFAQQVLPILKQKRPDIKFMVIGKNPSAELKELADDSITITGEVPSVAECLVGVDIVVAPLLSGAGLKNKVLEALAASRPTVASKIAVEGIEVLAGKHYLKADSPQEWVNAIEKLLLSPDEARMLSTNGRDQVLAKYSWSKAARAICNLYEDE